MTARFADTWFYVSLLDRDDAHHSEVVTFLSSDNGLFVTTRWVLLETLNLLGSTRLRSNAAELVSSLENDPQTTIIDASNEFFWRGLRLFTDRPDKGWSLTDCISFIVMDEYNLSEALTGDHHFTQAGFLPLFPGAR